MMKQAMRNMAWLLVGVGLGLLLSAIFDSRPTLALTTDRLDDVIVATAPWDEQETVEMVYVLDTRRGRLVATAVNPITGRFLGVAMRDIFNDMGVNPRGARLKLMAVAGRAALTGQTRYPVRHLLYVIDVNSGTVHAYTTPFTGYATAGGTTLQIVPVHRVQWGRAIPRR